MFFPASAKVVPVDIKEDAIIVDVRSAREFTANSNPASINIQLDELKVKMALLDKDKTIIVCCASGRRSAAAAAILKQNGFKKVIDAGSWRNTLS